MRVGFVRDGFAQWLLDLLWLSLFLTKGYAWCRDGLISAAGPGAVTDAALAKTGFR